MSESERSFVLFFLSQDTDADEREGEQIPTQQARMVLEMVRSFASSLTPRSGVSATKDPRDQESPAAVDHTSLQEAVPEAREKGWKSSITRAAVSAEPKQKPHEERSQQELEVDAFDYEYGEEEEEKETQSYESEDERDDIVRGDLIEISLGGDDQYSHHHHHTHHHTHHRHHNGHHSHHEQRYHSASDLETIDELIEYATEGDLHNFKRICGELSTRSVNPDSPGYMGWTPAHWAAREGHVHILDYLLHHAHVNLDALDKKGDSLLHKAAANGQYRACQWLLQYGFNVQTKNNNGQSALDVAQEHLALARTSEAALCEAILARENANTF